MSIIAGAVPSLAAGTLAKTLIRERGSPGFAVTSATGVTGAIAAAAVLLQARHLATIWAGHRTAQP